MSSSHSQGLELAASAVSSAKEHLEKVKPTLPGDAASRVSFVQGDFFTYNHEGGAFDWGYDYT